MKWLAGGLTFVNVTTVCGLIGGLAGHGLNGTVATLAAVVGFIAGLIAFYGTYNIPQEAKLSPNYSAASPETIPAQESGGIGAFTRRHYRSIWLWATVAVFAMFAFRSFCNVLFIDGNELKIQNPQNLGDLSLHLTYINNLSSGVDFWPDNPIYVFSKLRYPVGVDLFNAILICLNISLIRGLVWAGLLGSAALCYALYRWGGTFTIAGFLFNGGVAGFQFFRKYEWLDYEGGPFIAWKSLALCMLVTQRGLLYALPVGLLLLIHWRAKFFPKPDATGSAPPPPLPFWVELTLYASMPLFHVHTFMALSFVLLFLFFFLNWGARKQLAWLVGLALLPATFFVWLITDHFHASSVVKWNPGWTLNNGDFARPLAAFTQQPATVPAPGPGFFAGVKHFVEFWGINFGITLPLVVALIVLIILQTWKRRDEPAPVTVRLLPLMITCALSLVVLVALFAYLSFGCSPFVALALIPPVVIALMLPLFVFLLQKNWKQTVPVSKAFAFVLPAAALFLISCLVKTAPWEWDNIKLIIWAYLIVLPFLWTEIIARWNFPIRAVVCIALFGSGFFTIFGGLAAGQTGYGFTDRAEYDGVGVALRNIPVEARFAAYPIFNHPVLLHGRKVVLGYPGHVWTQGFEYGEYSAKLDTLMNGAPNWRETARYFRVRYMFWGREEKKNYSQSKRPWEQECKLVASGPWGAIYDLDTPRSPSDPPPPPP